MRAARLAALPLTLILILSACGTTAAPSSEVPAESQAAAAEAPVASQAAGSEEPAESEAPPAEDLERATLRLDFLAAPSHIPFIYGIEQGFYADRGIELVALEGTGSPVTLQIISSRADKFGFVDGGVYALGKAQDQPVAMVGTLIQTGLSDLVFFCEQNIEEPADLAGHSIAAPAGDSVMTLLPALLSAHGLTLDDLEVINVAAAARIPTVIEGQADIGVGLGYASALRYYQAAEQADAGEMCHLRLSDFGINTLGHGIVVNQQTIEEEPELIQAFMDATTEAFEATEADPDAAIDAIMSYFDLPDEEREIMEQGLEVVLGALHTENSQDCPLGWVHPDDAQQTIDLLTEYSGLETDLAPEQFYDNAFVGDC